MIIKINSEDIKFSEKFQDFCKSPYPNHIKGCQNYGKKKGCPPCKLIDDILDFNKDIYLVYTEFEIGEFARRMKEKHPAWSEKQCYNLLYWQKKARKEHEKEIEKTRKLAGEIVRLPESKGVNVNLLMSRIAKLEWPARKISRIVSLAGFKK